MEDGDTVADFNLFEIRLHIFMLLWCGGERVDDKTLKNSSLQRFNSSTIESTHVRQRTGSPDSQSSTHES